jgi:uncharacterized BrkB/YihY/UPF0761 family membrane protein
VLIVIAPLAVVSFGSASLTSSLIGPVLEVMGWESAPIRTALVGVGLALGFLVDLSILWILLGRLGGIRPHRRPRLIASLIGAVTAGVIKQLLEEIVAWSLDKPQYGAFAAPLAILLVLSLLAAVLYGSAALAGGISDRQVPLAELQPTHTDEATGEQLPGRPEAPTDDRPPTAGDPRSGGRATHVPDGEDDCANRSGPHSHCEGRFIL